MHLLRFFTVLAVAIGCARGAPTPARNYVIAHVIVGNTSPYSQSQWASDISLAEQSGIDGFALNYGSDGWQAGQLASAYAAALGFPSFRLFLSADMSSLSGGSQSDASSIGNQVAAYKNHPNQLVINGGAVLSTFSGESSTFGYGSVEAGWQAVINAVGGPVTFLPSFFVDPSTYGNYAVVAGGLNWNGGWPTSGSDITFDGDWNWINGLGNKMYIAAVSPNFFTHYSPQTWNKNWIYRSDDNLYATRWEMLIAQRSQIVIAEIISWNDFGESHYIGPIEGDQPNSQAWVDGYPHTAWLDLTSYYASAFKTGSYPAITKDKLYIYARPHPKAAIATSDSVGQPSGWQNTDDNFYVLLLATASGSVTLSTPLAPSFAPTTSQTFSVVPGVNKLKLALVPDSGMRATLTRGGAEVLDLWPVEYYFNPAPATYNFNAYVAMAST